VAPALMYPVTVETQHNDDRLGRIYRFLILLQVVAALMALIVGLAVAHHASQEPPDANQSTFERETPHISNWPTHRRPFPRG
jgi:Na+/H+-dicarboxylate symporter